MNIIMLLKLNLFYLLFLIFLKIKAEKCPINTQFKSPCSCVSMNTQGFGIICSEGQTFEEILDSLQPYMERPNIKIEFLKIENTPIPELSVNTLAYLPVRHLILRNNTLSHFQVLTESSSELSISSKLYDNVEQLEIQNNEITNIEDCTALTFFTNLQSLSLAGNKINEILENTFIYFNSRKTLKQLDLSENLLSDNSINSDAFIGLEFLQKLSLEKNRLNKLPTKALSILSDSLEELFLSANQIDKIEIGDIPSLPRLKSLGLDVNQISHLNSNIFNSIPSLWYLYLSQNQFTSIPSSIFGSIPELKVLSMGGNPIERIEDNSFLFANSLLRLDLSQCKINYLNNCFSPISRLQFINLRGNKIKYISNKLFGEENSKLSFLVSIDLAQNEIEKVDKLAFAGLNQLQSIDLSYNKIKTFDSNTFRGTFLQTANAAQLLDLIGNPINCNPNNLDWLISLRGKIRIQGRCPGEEQNMEGVELAKIAASTNTIINSFSGNKTGNGIEKKKNKKINNLMNLKFLVPIKRKKESRIENKEIKELIPQNNNFILNNETNNTTKSDEEEINALIEEEENTIENTKENTIQTNNEENGWFVLKLGKF
uniref:LRRCT domain-containing protein n=1 Tax=Meloidogyne hapla TaxID=6305 RepID=A0A1I8BFY0_MELHA